MRIGAVASERAAHAVHLVGVGRGAAGEAYRTGDRDVLGVGDLNRTAASHQQEEERHGQRRAERTMRVTLQRWTHPWGGGAWSGGLGGVFGAHARG